MTGKSSNKKQSNELLSIRIHPDPHAAIKFCAEYYGVTTSAFARDIIIAASKKMIEEVGIDHMQTTITERNAECLAVGTAALSKTVRSFIEETQPPTDQTD